MRNTRKLLSLLAAIMLLAALCTTALAAETTYTITVTDATAGHTYEAYQIFTGDLSDGKLSNIQWGTGLSADGQKAILGLYKLDPESKTAADAAAELVKNKNAADFAKLAGKYLTGTPAKSVEGNGSYTIEGLEPGYYLVKDQDSSLNGEDAFYTNYILNVAKDVTVAPKGSKPVVVKKVKDINDSNNAGLTAWQDSADYDIGDHVPFQLQATLGSDISGYSTYKLVFHDTLSAGLTFDGEGTVKAFLNGEEMEGKPTVEDDHAGNLTFTFENILAADVKAGDEVTVEYTATLNENAAIGSAGNTNTVYLEYSNNPNNSDSGNPDTGKTPADKVTVFTYQLIAEKVDGENKPLAGAKFTLYKKNSAGDYVAVGGEVEAAKPQTGEDVKYVASWKGLDDGDYKLVETTTPAGYNTAKDLEFTITASHDIDSQDPRLTALSGGVLDDGVVNTGAISTTVVNQAGSTLPSTGGIGTTVFFTAGGMLILSALILLAVQNGRKRTF